MVDKPIAAKPLDTPLDLQPDADPAVVDEAAKMVVDCLVNSKNAAVFVDCLVQRRQAVAETRLLVDTIALPVYTSGMGKGIIDETHDRYVGVYNGEPSDPGIEDAFRRHDVILVLGNLPVDTNSGGFSRKIPREKALSIDTDTVSIKDTKFFDNVPLKAVIQRLIAVAGATKARFPQVPNPRRGLPPPIEEDDADSETIRQSWIWHRIAGFLRPHDVLLCDSGTAAFGLPGTQYPPDTTYITQAYYGSIGYGAPAAVGSELALSSISAGAGTRGRTILIAGDGSLMLTIQEVANMVHLGLRPVIFIINNAGYTIERVIHGARSSYNDIVPFNYAHLLPFSNASESTAKAGFHRASTRAEVEEILQDDAVASPRTIQVVELVMDMMDVPWRLSTQVAMRGPEAVREMREAGFQVREPKSKGGFWS
jgi:pyruvate decarboxylase